MMQVMSTLLFRCRDVTQLVSASLDRELPLQQRLRLRLHFLICVLCRRYHNQVHFIHEALRNHPDRLTEPEGGATVSLSPESRDRIKHALAQRET